MATNPARDILIRAVMESISGLPKDRIVNDFAFFNGSDVTDADISTYMGWVNDFYRVPPDTTAVGEYISSFVNRSATHQLLGYRINADGSTGSPAVTEDWLGPPEPGSPNGLPTEVAAVLSFHADLTGSSEEVGSTRPRARRRGRLYIGPLIEGACDIDTPPFLLDDAMLGVFRAAAVDLRTASAGRWAVWSRKDATLRSVQGGWTDNAPDTQRRRGASSTARVTFG